MLRELRARAAAVYHRSPAALNVDIRLFRGGHSGWIEVAASTSTTGQGLRRIVRIAECGSS